MTKDFLEELDNELLSIGDTSKTGSIPKLASKGKDDKKTLTPKKPQGEKKGKPSHAQVNAKQNNEIGIFFPESKFYLPTLRSKYTRYIPVGGNNETGAKNMDMFQYNDDILLIDCGIQFAEPDMYGAQGSLPDISFLIPYKKNIQGLIITHAHLDHIGALRYILPQLGFPTIYATKLTTGIIKKGLDEAKILHLQKFVEINTDSETPVSIGKYFKCEFFRMNHSVPDCAGVFLTTPGGFSAIHTGDFKIDLSPELDKPADLSRIGNFGRRGVTLFLSDSTGSTRKGFSKSEKQIGETLEEIIASHEKGRLIITIFSSWISRVQQIIRACEKHGKVILLSGRSMVENIAIATELGYIKAKPGTIKKMGPKTTQGIPLNKQVIITTGSQGEEFSALSRMADGKHASMEIMKGDTIVFSSSVVPGNEKNIASIMNKLTRLGANIVTKDDGEVHTGGHALQEEQKIMLNLVQPKYFSPIYGDVYFRSAHAETAISIGFKRENILMLDNGHIVDFAPDQKVFKSKIKVPIQDFLIDGKSLGNFKSHVMQAREQMMRSGTLVIIYKVDDKSGAVLGHIKIESRGFLYPEEVKALHGGILKKAKTSYETTIQDVSDIEEKDLVKVIRGDLEKYIEKKIDRYPMIIPVIIRV